MALNESEIKEKNILIDLKLDHSRWFTQSEFERLEYLSKKEFEDAGSPFEEFKSN